MRSLLFAFLLTTLVIAQPWPPVPHNIVTQWVTEHSALWRTNAPFPVQDYLRAESIVDNAMFDATAAYTSEFTPTLGRSLVPLRPLNQRNDSFRSKALSFAAYRVLQHFYSSYPSFSATTTFFTSLGYDPADVHEDNTSPSGLGNRIARYLLEDRAHDGANEYADEPGTKIGGGPYSDYTEFYPVNNPQAVPEHTQCSELRDINKWQPLTNIFMGIPITQVWSGPEFGFVRPFALRTGFDFLPSGTYLLNTNTHDQCVAQINQIIDTSGSLSDYQKAIGEWWGGIDFSQLAVDLATRKSMSIKETAKFIFLHGMAELDGGIAAWGIKRLYDTARPISYIQCFYSNATIRAYLGPYQGSGNILGKDWQPYPFYDVIVGSFYRTPPFGDYISGHATSAGAVYEAYKRYFGSDVYNRNLTFPAGSSVVEPKRTAGQPGYIAGLTDVPNSGPGTPGYSPAQSLSVRWNTFSEAADSAGLSRMYLGIHLQKSNTDGVAVGRKVAGEVFKKWKKYIN